MKEAFEKGLITESIGNHIWNEMIGKRRKLGYKTFSDYLRANR